MPTIAVEDADRLRAFEMRLQKEGAAAFADGPAPWERWDDIGTLGSYRVWMDSVRHPPAAPPPPRKPLTTRLLTGLAQLAVLALLVGTAGVYLSIIAPPQQLAYNGIQPPPIVVSGRPVTAAQPVLRNSAVAAVPESAALPGEDLPVAAPSIAVVPLELEPVPATAGAEPESPAAETLAASLDALPGTAAGPAGSDITADAGLATSAPEPVITPEPVAPAAAAVTPAADAPLQLALQTPAIDRLPEKPAAPPAPAREARDLTGTWVVNLAAYNFESMAERKLAAFRKRGVNAELARVMINGKPMIRIRTTGYQSRREASDWVALLEERLALDGAWVAKYEPGLE